MIESIYWKEDLIQLAKDLSHQPNPRRYSEKYQVNMEKRIILCFFIIRKLMELKTKLTENVYNYKTTILRYPANKNAFITKMNDGIIEKHYKLDTAEKKNVNINFICNQLIHHEIIFLLRDKTRNFENILVCSDYEQNKYLYEFKIKQIIEILIIVGNDYVTNSQWLFNEKENDYIIINS